MKGRYDRYFTEEAKEIIGIAYDEAEKWHHDQVDIEHLLLAFLKDGETKVNRFLTKNGLTYQKVARRVKEEVGRGEARFSLNELGSSSNLKSVMNKAYDLAQKEGFKAIKPGHLFVAILEEGRSPITKLLREYGVDLGKARWYFLQSRRKKVVGRNLRKKEKKTGLDFGRNLIEEAEEGRLDPVIGRENEIERIIQTLSRRKKNNPAVIGETGVGKTAVVEGLAQKIADKEVPLILREKEIIELDMAAMVAGTKYRGEFEQRLKSLVNKVSESDHIILFIDELQTLVGAGGAEGAIDASSILKPPLASGIIQCIGTATPDEYRKSIEKDPALERRFKKIPIEEPTIEQTVSILEGLRSRYEDHHEVEITAGALYQAGRLSDRYITDHFLPDKAIDLIDETAAKIKLATTLPSPEIRELEDRIKEIEEEKERAASQQDYEQAKELRDQSRELQDELAELKMEAGVEERVVNGDDIAEMVSSWTGVPVGHMKEEESKRVIFMEGQIHERYINQDEAVRAVSKSIRRAYAGIKDPKRPIGSFLFLGPTGVGKTELSKALAAFLFGDEEALVRVDMSEYMERFSVSRLIGAPPGYVGYEEAGELTKAIRRRPYSVILFDEIEKAHRDVFNILLQVMDDGILTDAQGRRVDFRNTVLIMTSNLGGKSITDRKALGFGSQGIDSKESYQAMKDRVMEEVKDTFRPEFLNRLDDTIVFHQLTKDQVYEIADLMLEEFRARLTEKEIEVVVTPPAKALLVEKGYDPKYGARPLRRTIEKMIENPISDKILEGAFTPGDRVKISSSQGKMKFETQKSVEVGN